MCGNSAYDWNIMFTGRRYGGSDARSSPSTKILPEVAVSSPASMRSNVDLPQPELPSSANSSFFAIVRFTLSTAVLSPNFFTTFSMRTNASFCVRAAGAGWVCRAAAEEGIDCMGFTIRSSRIAGVSVPARGAQCDSRTTARAGWNSARDARGRTEVRGSQAGRREALPAPPECWAISGRSSIGPTGGSGGAGCRPASASSAPSSSARLPAGRRSGLARRPA
ncbi:MAG: hypothetical protein GAK33_03358 [Burkholderia lata]|uniref:Uncharacterized protein n=1 Tax=Burkholderia lata (strain ATCC 17760 / DSM 23089 / LMG 22485 / NCIMB 9086 / R18194 / 383) TaxID=482957 RepID=A0A833PPH9_BURL3|nr:MAG: hypothetical protein GAK33_03358 [Burkholderia lata]